MKKSLIALAVLAASGAAMAQSTVTLYGRVDASIGSIKDTTAGGTSTTKMFNGDLGGLTTSRWGLMGTEDLGGGLKAFFKLENRFNVDDGTQNSSTRQFHGDAHLGLAGNFGTVYLGRTYTAYDGIAPIAISSSVFDSAFTPTGGVYGKTGLANYAGRGDNQVKYVSPSFSGFGFAASHALDESNAVKTDISSVALSYSAGALKVGLGFQDEGTRDYTALTGSYNFGVASVSAGYQMADQGTVEDDEFSVGVNVPMGAFNFSAGYARSKSENAGAANGKGSGFGLGVTYSLSKRTTLYAGFKDNKVKNAAGTKVAGSERLYAAGIRHDF